MCGAGRGGAGKHGESKQGSEARDQGSRRKKNSLTREDDMFQNLIEKVRKNANYNLTLGTLVQVW